MTLKGEEPPLVPATLVGDEPEYNLNASAPPAPVAQPYVVQGNISSTTASVPIVQGVTSASMNKAPTMVHGVSSLPSQPPSMPNYPTGSTTTTTTYTIPAPIPMQQMGAAPSSIGHLGRNSRRVTCQFCHTQCNTRTHDRIDAVTILLVIVLLLVFWPLFWLPLVVPCCKTTEHCCGNCNRVVGRTEPCD